MLNWAYNNNHYYNNNRLLLSPHGLIYFLFNVPVQNLNKFSCIALRSHLFESILLTTRSLSSLKLLSSSTLLYQHQRRNMGLLTIGEPLNWPETKAYAEHVRAHGIQQFLNIYKARKHRKDEVLKWGDEVC